jgi:hypothetical protein
MKRPNGEIPMAFGGMLAGVGVVILIFASQERAAKLETLLFGAGALHLGLLLLLVGYIVRAISFIGMPSPIAPPAHVEEENDAPSEGTLSALGLGVFLVIAVVVAYLATKDSHSSPAFEEGYNSSVNRSLDELDRLERMVNSLKESDRP